MLTTPIPGEAIRADLLREIIEELRASRVQPGPGILVQRGPSGTVVAAAERDDTAPAPAASGDIVVAKITGGTTLTGYDVTCYPAYPSTAASYAAKLAVPEIALGTELPAGTYVIAHKLSVEIMGGTPA